jgi:hypothetical protein
LSKKHPLGDSGQSDQEEGEDALAGDPSPEDKSITDYPTTRTTDPCPELNGANPVPDPPSQHSPTANTEMNGGVLSLPLLSPTALTTNINGEDRNTLALHVSNQPVPTSGPPGFLFSSGTSIQEQPSTFDPLSCDFSLATDWNVFPSDSATASQSVNISGDFWFGNRENPSGLTLSNGAQHYNVL